MLIKLLILSLLSISAFSSGIWVLGNKVQTTDFFTCLHQTNPDFAIIAMDLQTQNWAQFAQSHQNALAAGYKHIHVSIASWQPLQPGSLPQNFSGRVWITTSVGQSYPHLVSMIENIASLGFNAGILDDSNLAKYMTGVVPSVVSSVPFAFKPTTGPWVPFAGWQCPLITVGAVASQCDQLVQPLIVNIDCV